MQAHEVLDKYFPQLESEQFEKLKQDIAENGQKEPIWTHQNKIIDGRQRWRACQELGRNCLRREWLPKDGESIVTFIVSCNLHRRHLDTGPRAALALQLLPEYEREAKERQRIHANTAPGKPANTCGKIATSVVNPSNGNTASKAREQAAAAVGVSARYVQDIKKLHNEAPALFHKVATAEITIPEAMRTLQQKEEKLPTLDDTVDEVCDKLMALFTKGIHIRNQLNGLLAMRSNLDEQHIERIRRALFSLKDDVRQATAEWEF